MSHHRPSTNSEPEIEEDPDGDEDAETGEDLTFGEMVDRSAERTDLEELYKEHDGL